MTRENCFILAGELSGEEHAQTFLPQLMKHNPHYHFWGVGGEYFKTLGVEILYSIKDFSSMGFTDVIKKISFYKQARKEVIGQVIQRKTQLAILIDFQGFNMSLLKPLFEQGVKVLYFVAPQAWAWKSWRTILLQKYVTKLYCILPFEESWFKSRGVFQAEPIAHPSFTRLIKHRHITHENKNYIVWLPGSRKGEISIHWPLFIDVLAKIRDEFPSLEHVVVTSPAFRELGYEQIKIEGLKYRDSEDLFQVLDESFLSVAASGTVTLNCALLKVPTIVCYRVNLLNAWIFRSFIKYKGFVSLANLMLNKPIFPELLQENCQTQLIYLTIKKWLEEPKIRDNIKSELAGLIESQKALPESAFNSMNTFFIPLEV